MTELEREAIEVLREKKFWLMLPGNGALKSLLLKIADRLDWQNLKKEL